jgi:hypothetical protein
VAYSSGDDPQLLKDIRSALNRWHRPTLGDVGLATKLVVVQRRLAADQTLTRSSALRLAVRAALATMRDRGRGELADLLERRYFRGEGVVRLTQTYHVSERTIYHRLREALVALAHALWAQEQVESGEAPVSAVESRALPTSSQIHHVPPRTYDRLFGREDVLAQLLEYLEDRDGHWVISLDGMAGLGKTALAREAVGRLAGTDRFRSVVWVTVSPGSYAVRGPKHVELPALTCGQVLDTIAGQLGVPGSGSHSLPAKKERVRELLGAEAYLVVLDHLEAVMDCGILAGWFWEVAKPSKFLLTSRHWLESDVGFSSIYLHQLSTAESLALIRHEAGLRGLREVTGASDDALNEILSVTGGNPLAIRLVVGQLVTLPLSQILSALQTAQPETDEFYQYLYSISWQLVSAPGKRLLRCMVRLPAGQGTWDELSAASGLSGDELAGAIETLTTHSLLQVSGFEEKTYCLHPLTYHFASSQVTP